MDDQKLQQQVDALPHEIEGPTFAVCKECLLSLPWHYQMEQMGHMRRLLDTIQNAYHRITAIEKMVPQRQRDMRSFPPLGLGLHGCVELFNTCLENIRACIEDPVSLLLSVHIRLTRDCANRISELVEPLRESIRTPMNGHVYAERRA